MASEYPDRAQHKMRGAPGGFDAVYQAYGDRIYRFCYRLCRRAEDAEDLTQETFLAAFQGQERFEGRSSIATWLYRIALYRWRAIRSRRGPEVTMGAESRAGAPRPEDDGLQRLALDDALAALPDDLREIFLLVKAEGLTYREAASVLRVPQGTLQYRVHEASRRLRDWLTADDECDPADSAPSAVMRRKGISRAL